MSQKITSKNLTYDDALPPFLAALRARASGSSGPDPILASQRRAAGKKRSGSEEAEDAPVVVDEHGIAVEDVTVDKHGTVTERGVVGEGNVGSGDDDDEHGAEGASKSKKKAEEKVVMSGRKRKVGKVIGADADADSDAPVGKHENPDEKTGDDAKKGEKKDADALANKKGKKKAKKIKLSFDEGEG